MSQDQELLSIENSAQLEASRSFEALKTPLKEFIRRTAETDYGKTMGLDKLELTDYQSWVEQVPRLTAENYSSPRQYVRSDSNHPIEDMTLFYSGGTSGSPKETYYAPEDSGIRLSQDLEELIKSKEFLFLGEKKDTVSNKLLKNWANLSGVENSRYEGFDSAEEFLNFCKQSKGNIYLTLQVSSARILFSQLAETIASNPDLANDLPPLENLLMDLVAETVKIEELSRWYDTLKILFKTEPIISVPYAQTEHKLIGLYHYVPGDKEIKYKVIDGMFVEVTDPDTGKPLNGHGNLVLTNTNKSLGSLYVRYDTGDQATVNYESDGTAYISEVGRDPNKNQINLRGNKIYMHAFHEAIQERLGPDLPIRTQFQLLEKADRTSSVLKIEIGGVRLTDDQINLIKSKVAQFMGEDIYGYRFLWYGGEELIPGEVYKAPGVSIEISYPRDLEWDNPKSFRRLPDSTYEDYYKSVIKN